MFNVGDMIIYSTHGICKVDDICEKTVLGITRTYYVLHPMENDHQLTITTPVNNDKVVMLDLIHKEEANEILDSFNYPGVAWDDKPNFRFHHYSEIVNSGDRNEIAKVVNTLMRKQIEAERYKKKLYERDRALLNSIQNILFKELAFSLDKTFEEIHETVLDLIKASN